MILAMSIIIAAWIILFCLIAGIGQLARRCFGPVVEQPSRWFDSFWVGYALLIGALEAWHLFLPINWRTGIVFAIVGAIGFILALKAHIRSSRSIRWLIFAMVLLVPLAIWFANRALDAQMDFDTGLYHLSTIRWTNDYSVVPGLGNLHYRLAFNQSPFLFVALLNLHPYFDQGMHFANSLLVIVLAAQLINGIVHSLRHPDQFSAYRLYEALWLAIVIYRASRQPYSANMSSPSPDLPVFILMAVASLMFARYLFSVDWETDQRFTVFSIMAVSIVGTTTKLSFAVFGVSTIVLVMAVWLFRHRAEMAHALRQFAVMGAIAIMLIGVPWLVHGILTSGYPMFPSRLAALPVDYRIPASIAKEAEEWVYSFAREPQVDSEIVFRDYSWIPGWFGRMRNDFNAFLFYIPFFITLAALAAYVALMIVLWLFRRRSPIDWRFWLLLLPALASGIFWFLSAPDPRFAGSAFWVLALGSIVLLLSLVKTMRKAWTYGAILLPTAIAATFIVLGIHANFKLNGPGFPKIPVVPMREFHTESGLVVYIPSIDNLQLWDAPLPSSPYELPLLEMRTADLRDGFRMRPDSR